MREIKFRAWDESQNYMAYQGTPDLESIQSFMHHFGDKTLMQFTGLKDKNGKEIYEGDIIKSNVEYRTGNIIEVIEEVYFDEKLGGYMFGNKHSTDKESDTVEFGVCMALSDSVEIIGNIYNNPDLFFCVTEADA